MNEYIRKEREEILTGLTDFINFKHQVTLPDSLLADLANFVHNLVMRERILPNHTFGNHVELRYVKQEGHFIYTGSKIIDLRMLEAAKDPAYILFDNFKMAEIDANRQATYDPAPRSPLMPLDHSKPFTIRDLINSGYITLDTPIAGHLRKTGDGFIVGDRVCLFENGEPRHFELAAQDVMPGHESDGDEKWMMDFFAKLKANRGTSGA